MDLMPRKFYLDNFFDDFMSSKKEGTMQCDIYEKEGNYHIEMDIPGFNKEDIKIEVNDGYLSVTAEKENIEDEDDNKSYIRHERVYGKYSRSFYLGELDQDKIEAEFKNGILKITVPKEEKINNKKTIEIK